MAIPSRVLGELADNVTNNNALLRRLKDRGSAGNSPLSSTVICGDGATALVATGTTASDALQLSAVFSSITTSSASTGVKLPPTEVGMVIGIRNDSGQTIAVYPYSTASTINAAATSVNLADAKTMLVFATSSTKLASVTTA